jgi:hypothetical protein
MLAMSRQREFVPWTDVDTVEGDPERLLVVLSGRGRRTAEIPCSRETFEQVLAFAEERQARSLGRD